MLRTLIEERDQEKRRADQETRRSDELRVEMLRLQLELERYKKWYYGLALIVFNPLPIWRRCF